MNRVADIARDTTETKIRVRLNLDGNGLASVSTGIGFYDHLLTTFAHHGLFDMEIEATGDLGVDDHHLVEDTALVLGLALAEALDDREGIHRFGEAAVPMDESLARAAVDVGGRPYALIDLPFRSERIGNLTAQNIAHALEALAEAGGITLHVDAKGRNDHHLAEAAFKAVARAVRAAVALDERRTGLASTKGAV